MPKQKGILLMVRWPIAIYSFTVAFEWLYSYFVKKQGRMMKILYVQAFVPLSGKIRQGREWQWGHVASNLNSCSWAGCPSHSGRYVNISTPPTTFHSYPAPVPDTRFQDFPSLWGSIRKSCVSFGHRDLVWHHHLRPDRAPNLNQEPLPGQGNFPFYYLVGGA